MSQVQPELRNWTGGAMNIIRLIGKASSFATLFKINKMSENLKNFENLKGKKKIKIQPCAQPNNLLITGQVF